MPPADDPAEPTAAEPTAAERAARLVRREPPRFRRVAVQAVEPLSPRLVRVAVAGPELEGLTVDQPAASVRLLLPDPGGRLDLPSWDGNEFLLPDGRRPAIRTFTPRHLDPAGPTLAVDVVLHEGGRASQWATAARAGDPVAVSGTGRGFEVDPTVDSYLLVGDETAIPAVAQLLESIPGEAAVDVHLEVAHPDARLALPRHPGATVTWHDLPPGAAPGAALVDAVTGAHLGVGHVWVAGEAAAVQRVRRLLADRGVPRTRTTVRGYWKHGRAGT